MFDRYRELKDKGINPVVTKRAFEDTEVAVFTHSVKDPDTGATVNTVEETMTKDELLKHIKALRKRLNAAKEVYESVFGPEI